ncbi:MAG: hypothetical protein E3J87_09300 [Candidatus Cloacimonadota bacterium]|nr:MAG: hypothetical protein E3J87_09300 [Candidatus Cloacimonadota bacterium]
MNIKELFEDFLKDELRLDEKQFDAVMGDKEKDKTAYRLLITAPAGSGKTRVLASRYLKLLVDGEKPENIIAITFTRKAAGEMKERIVDYILKLRDKVIHNNLSCDVSLSLIDRDKLNRLILGMRISTIDSFLSKIIRLFPGESGVDPNFKVIDEIEEEELIDNVIDGLIEERMEKDRKIIDLLRFFNFIYSPVASGQFCFLNSIKKIISNWEMYCDTILKLSHTSKAEIAKGIKRFIGEELSIVKRLNDLEKKVMEFKGIYQKKTNAVNDFIDFISHNSIDTIRNNKEKFMSYIDLFYTKDKHLRKRLIIKLEDSHTQNMFREISLLYERCIQAFLLEKDIEHGYLSKNFVELITSIMERLKRRKKELGVLGIGDLKTVTYELLTKHRERFNVLYNMDARVNHYLIDEFQDTDPIQWDIFSELTRDWFSGETAKQELNIIPTIFLVGDEKQSIYSFRNADVRIMNDIKEKEDFFTKTFYLVKNYRSKKEIVESVNLLFREKMKRLKDRDFSVGYEEMIPDDVKGGGTVKIIECSIEGRKNSRIPQLAESVAGLILSLNERFKSWDNIALLFRDSLNFHFYEEIFEKKGIPYISSGGKSFFENREVREIIKILNFLENPYDDINFSALFLSPIFTHSLSDLLRLVMCDSVNGADSDEALSLYEKLGLNFIDDYRKFFDLTRDWLNKRDKISYSRLIEEIIMETNAYGILVDRRGGQKDVNIKKILHLIENISQEKMNYSFFFDRLNRVIKAREKNADIDIGIPSFEEEETGALHIMTVHKAKGLEFSVVIVPEVDSAVIKGKIEGISLDRDNPILLFLKKYNEMETPLLKKFKERMKEREEEELKRLFYVALTRAKEELYLFISQKKRNDRKVWMNIVCDSNLPRTDKLEMTLITEKEKFLSPALEHAVYRFTEKKKRIPLRKETTPSEKEIVLYNIENERAKIKGTILHKLFEFAGAGMIKKEKMKRFSETVRKIANQVDDQFISNDNFLDGIEKEFSRVMGNEEIMKVITNEHSLTEFSYSLERENENGETEIVSGIMDKVLFDGDEVSVYDFKTDSLGGMTKKEFIDEAKKKYKKQMEAYRYAAQKLFEKENVRIFLILTSILEIIEV